MTAKYTTLIWGADLERSLKFVALALADSAGPYGIVPYEDKKPYAWLTGYTVEELDKVVAKLIKAGILTPMADNHLCFSMTDTPQLVPYWQEAAAVDAGPETEAALRFQLAALHIQPETVDELIQNYPAELINSWLDVYELAVAFSLADGCGYLVSALRHNWDIEIAKSRIAARQKQHDKQSAVNALPDELIGLLQKLEWEDSLDEIIRAHKDNPDRLLAWVKHAESKGWKAGRFRNALRSGLIPPDFETVMMPAITILEDAEISLQDDWPSPSEKAVSTWQACLEQIALMPDLERGFKGGDFASWLRPAQPISIECTGLDTTFTIRSCNNIAAEWIADHARGAVEDVLGDLLDCSVNLESVC